MLDHIRAQLVAHRFLIPVSFFQQPLHSVRVRFSQFLGHLPAVLALDRSQQSLQVASHPCSHLGAAKVRPNPSHQFSQGLRALTADAQLPLFLTAGLLCPFFGGHLLHLPEASYHICVLTGTVVLSPVSAITIISAFFLYS